MLVPPRSLDLLFLLGVAYRSPYPGWNVGVVLLQSTAGEVGQKEGSVLTHNDLLVAFNEFLAPVDDSGL